jgi:hypothetical protein
VLLPLARLDKGGGFYRLYHEPWTQAELNAPQITDVDSLLVNVSQAFYDTKKRALIVTLKPGPVSAHEVSFVARGLKANATYTIVKDGHILGQVSRSHPTGVADVALREDATVAIKTSLDAPHSFVIVESGS